MKSYRVLFVAILASLLAIAMQPAFADSPTLAKVKDRGVLNCTSHNGNYPGFAELDDEGRWHGLDIALCRAVATAIFGDPDAVNFEPISWAQRWPALRTGEVDLVIKASGCTLGRDTELDFQCSRPYYLGTTKIMFHKDLGISKMAEADGAIVCVPAGTHMQRPVGRYANQLGIAVTVKPIDDPSQMRQTYYSGACHAFAQWGPIVAITRSLAPDPDKSVILPDVLAVEPEAAYVRKNDDEWLDVVNWTLNALWFAEKNGITSDNVDDIRADPPSSQIAKFLGVTSGVGDGLGLSDDWAYNVIKKVGNYAEIWDRTVGKDSPYKIKRGVNALWSDGGVHYSWVFD